MKALEVPRRTVVTRKSISEAPEILLTPPVPQSPSIRRAPPHTPAPAAPGRDPAQEKIIENLTARVNQLELTAEELRNELRIAQSDRNELKIAQPENQRKVADLAALVEGLLQTPSDGIDGAVRAFKPTHELDRTPSDGIDGAVSLPVILARKLPTRPSSALD